MKTLAVALSLLAAATTAILAQTGPLTAIHTFAFSSLSMDSLTTGPDGWMYGTAEGGPTNGGLGCVFRVKTDGTFEVVAALDEQTGRTPHPGLTLGPDGNLYGTTEYGGPNIYGTAFRVTTTGVLTKIANFSPTLRCIWGTHMVLGKDGNFYGPAFCAESDRADYTPAIFRLTPAGSLSVFAHFPEDFGISYPGSLSLAKDGNFYGTTYSGSTETGAAFRMTPEGVITKLTDIQGLWMPYATGLKQGLDGNFYGTTFTGGDSGRGSIFKLTPAGQFTTLFSFTDETGILPAGGLLLGGDGALYGTTSSGGNGSSTIFKITTEGAFSLLARFDPIETLGSYVYSGLSIGPDDALYGTAYARGANDMGTIFRLPVEGMTNPNDTDSDGVANLLDRYPDTPKGQAVNKQGASIAQLVPRTRYWKNHAAYVAEIVRVANAFRAQHLITATQSTVIIQAAARSTVGTPKSRLAVR